MSQAKKIQVLSFGVRLQELMTRDDLTQRQLADAIGVSQGAISHYLRGTRATPGVEEAIALAKHFGVSLDWLLGIDLSPLASPAKPNSEISAKRDAEIETVAKTLEQQSAKLRGLLAKSKKQRSGRKRSAANSQTEPRDAGASEI